MIKMMESFHSPHRDPSVSDTISSRSGTLHSPNSTVGTCQDPIRGMVSDELPNFDSFPGYYNFQFTIESFHPGDRGEKNKGQNYVVISESEDGTTCRPKLFAKPGHQWPLSYTTHSDPPPGAFIKVTPVFRDPDVAQEVVIRCPNHVTSALPDEDYYERLSIIQVTRTSAQYIQDPYTKRFCVVIPFQKPEEGSIQTTFNCKFVCFSSCSILRRRDCYLIITLEWHNHITQKFDVLGRQCLQFRSCACPTRDVITKKKTVGEKKAKRGRISKDLEDTKNLSNLTSGSTVFLNGIEFCLRLVPRLIEPTITSMVERVLRSEGNCDESHQLDKKLHDLRAMELQIANDVKLPLTHPSIIACPSVSSTQSPVPHSTHSSLPIHPATNPHHHHHTPLLSHSYRDHHQPRHHSFSDSRTSMPTLHDMSEIPDDVFQLVMDHQRHPQSHSQHRSSSSAAYTDSS